MKMKKIFSSVISMVTAISLLAVSVSASWDLDEQQAVEGDISSFVQVEEVTFGEPEPIEQPLAAEEELYQMEWMGELFDVEASGEEIQPMADLPDLSVRNLQIKAGDMTSPYPAGMLMYYTFQILNYGTADANGAEVIIKLDGEVATNPVSMGNVPAGKGGNIQFRGPEMSPGSHTMEIVVNPDRKIAESNYNNNTTSNTFTYKACFELVAVSMTSHKQTDENMVPTYEVGESVTFTMDFQNSGLLDVQNVPIALYGTFRAPGEQPVTSQMGYTNYIAKLPAKTRMKATVNLTFTKEASARISFVLDPEKVLGDMDYNNNTAETNLKVAGGTDKKYALCIGVNKDKEPDPGHFSEIALTAHQSFTDAGLNSTFNASPDIDFLLSTNSNSGRHQLASDILFFYGHGNTYCQAFWSNNNKTGIWAEDKERVGTTAEDGTPAEFAEMLDEDFQHVGLVSFIGCKTADSQELHNIAQFAVDQGAQASLGFKETIYGEATDSKNWILRYIQNLCSGYSLKEAVDGANREYSNCDLTKKFKIFGNENYQVVENPTRSINTEKKMEIPNELLSESVKLEEGFLLQELDDVDAIKYPEYQEIYDIIQSVDASFDPKDYQISIHSGIEGDDHAQIFLQYCIGGKIMTSKYYVLTYDDGSILSIVKKPYETTFNNEPSFQKELLESVQQYEKQAKAFSAEEVDAGENIKVTPTEKEYYYDYETGELKELRRYVLEYPDTSLRGIEREILIP